MSGAHSPTSSSRPQRWGGPRVQEKACTTSDRTGISAVERGGFATPLGDFALAGNRPAEQHSRLNQEYMHPGALLSSRESGRD
jgi:hypothetical protein